MLRPIVAAIALFSCLNASLLWGGTFSADLPAVSGEVHAEVWFTPGSDAAGRIAAAIAGARHQVRVQAFSFTHAGIANALIEAHRRGIGVRVIADREQTENLEQGLIPQLARAGIPVWLDGAHQSAHNKVIIIDGEAIVTGSFNFTNAAQYKNAENLVLLSGNKDLAAAYLENWQQHLKHSKLLAIH